MTQKWVYAFGAGSAEGSGEGHDSGPVLLGGKGANLAQMCRMGLPVPPGFTLTTEVCAQYFHNERNFPDALKDQVQGELDRLAALTGARLGDPIHPLLVAVRSGARVSMPGMMDTVLNLGLNAQTVEGLAAATGDARFAYDSYRRFLQMYADVVLGLDLSAFDEILETHKDDKGAESDTDLDEGDLKSICEAYKAEIIRQSGAPFGEDIHAQLWNAIAAVLGSWQSPRAKTWRKLNSIPEDWGTAVTVQAMVFGNRGSTSATGVAFTRDPATGDKSLYGEFLLNAQGEDVVAGIRNPQALSNAMRARQGGRKPSLEDVMPDIFAQLSDIGGILEAQYRDMQDMEFTVQAGKLFLLQTRSGKRTAKAALKMAVDMVAEGLIEKTDALARLDAAALDQLLLPTLDPAATRDEIATGLGASPGAATGEVVFTAQEAVELGRENRAVILVRAETSPDDIHGMYAAKGVLTARGGLTSHAAVVARGMGRPCVSGASALRIDAAKGEMTGNGITIKRGDVITLDGAAGKAFKGAVPMRRPELSGDFAKVMQWADEVRCLKIRADADTCAEARAAIEAGADGIGLCRTEHMLLGPDAQGTGDGAAPLGMRAEFAGIFREMAGLPVAIRLFEPPHHLDLDEGELSKIHVLQLQAIVEAAQDAAPGALEILVPLAGLRSGFDAAAAPLRALLRDNSGVKLPVIRIGAMLDSLRAVEMAASAECFCLHADDMSDVADAPSVSHGEKRKFGVCGERVSAAVMIRFSHDSGFEYVSCMSSRVQIARIVAAQAALKQDTKKP